MAVQKSPMEHELKANRTKKIWSSWILWLAVAVFALIGVSIALEREVEHQHEQLYITCYTGENDVVCWGETDEDSKLFITEDAPYVYRNRAICQEDNMEMVGTITVTSRVNPIRLPSRAKSVVTVADMECALPPSQA